MERGLGILFAYLTQVCFFKEIPSGLDVAGSAIITCTILFVSVRKLVESGQDAVLPGQMGPGGGTAIKN